jgi:hypothetical protein
VKFEVTDSFRRDYKKLKPEHREQFRDVVRSKFAPACAAWAEATSARRTYVWPKSLRVDEMAAAPGVMEMTWSFASPDGRATFSLRSPEDDFICVWRRIGDHHVLANP